MYKFFLVLQMISREEDEVQERRRALVEQPRGEYRLVFV